MKGVASPAQSVGGHCTEEGTISPDDNWMIRDSLQYRLMFRWKITKLPLWPSLWFYARSDCQDGESSLLENFS